MNIRTKFTVILTPGSHAYNTVKTALSEYLSTYYGGCTFLDSEGAWREDASEFKSKYEASLITENSLCVWCSVMPDKTECFVDELCEFLSSLKQLHKAEFSFVHIESQTVNAHHKLID